MGGTWFRPPGLGKQRERSMPECIRAFLAPRRQGNPPTGCATCYNALVPARSEKNRNSFRFALSGINPNSFGFAPRAPLAQRSSLPQRAALGTREGALDSPRRLGRCGSGGSPRMKAPWFPQAFMTDAQGNATKTGKEFSLTSASCLIARINVGSE